MASRRFYCPRIGLGLVELPPDEAHHARAVLRMSVGDPVTLFDGGGSLAHGRLTTVSRRSVVAEVPEVMTVPFDRRLRLTLVVGLPRGPRQHYLFEKCTELGVAAIWPVICERSVARLRPQADGKPSRNCGTVRQAEAAPQESGAQESGPPESARGCAGVEAVSKWTRVMVEAARQSERAWVPHVEPAQPVPDAIARVSQFDASILAAARGEAPGLAQWLTGRPGLTTLSAWIGPEGGFSPSEQDALVAAGVQPVGLGPAILRVETAAVVVASLVGSWSESWR